MKEDINYEMQKGCMKFGIIICIILIFIVSGLIIVKCSKYNKNVEISVQPPIEETHTIDSLVDNNKHKDSVLIKIDSIKNEKVQEVKTYSNDSTLKLFKELVSE